jgi:hypothetical protein
MKSQKLSIYLDNDNRVIEGMINIASRPPWIIEFTTQDISKLTFENKDLFECLIDLRKELVKLSCRPLCNGARLNIHPSSMSRAMGGGRIACILHLGEQAKREDMVDIFKYAEPCLTVSVDEQQNFYHNWIKSLK